MKNQSILVLLLTFLLIGSMESQDFRFDHFSIKTGLSDNSVRDILQDSRGYLWLATLNGLDRFDGKSFKNFTAIPGDPSSLRNSRIQEIIEDRKGYIWCISLDGNVHRVDPATHQVLDLYSQILHQNVPIRSFLLAPSGDLWLWGWSGCVKISYEDGNEEPLATLYDQVDYLPNDTIHFVHEDRNKQVWIGTESGLVRLTRNGASNYIVNNYLEGQAILSFYEEEHVLWFGTERIGLKRFELSHNRFQAVLTDLPAEMKGQPILCIKPIADQRLLLGSAQMVIDVDLRNNTLEPIAHPRLINAEEIFSDSHKNFWLAAENRGVFKYDATVKQLRYYALNAESRYFLGDLDKQILFEDSNHNFWIGIHGGGLFLYLNEESRFSQYFYSEDYYNELSSNIVLSLFEDNSKNLWVGTMYGGVNKINLSGSGFVWHQPIEQPENTFDNEIRTAITDKNGNLWLGSKGGKLFCYDEKYLKLFTLPDDLSTENQARLKNINVYCLHFDQEDNLWIGTKGKGIFVLKDILDWPGDAVEILHFDKSFQAHNTEALDEIFSICQDRHGQFWIGSHFSGLTLLSNPFTSPQFSVFTKEETKGQLVSNFIRYLFLDQADNLWIGTSHGISLLPDHQLLTREKEFIPIINDKHRLSSLSYNSVDYIFQASDQSIYLATLGGGLNKLMKIDWQTRQFDWRYYNKSDGLSTNTLYAIQEDDDHNLWISTTLGINKFNPATETFENFFIEKSKGLNYYSESCATKNGNGEIIFGHNRGFLLFNPQEILKDSSQYPVILSRFFVNGVEVTPKSSRLLQRSVEFENSIKLNHRQNSIQLDFSVLDFQHPEKIQFSYKLENYDDKWSTPLTVNSASYQNLPPGDYTFRLKGTNSDGVAMDDELNFYISITPPFFRSSLGYALIIFLSGLVIWFILHQNNRRIKAKHQIAYAEKLNEKKMKYYTNISHEFKTPLTMIINPVEDIIQDEGASPEIISNATHIRKNAVYLLNLVEQILDFRKIREEKMPLSVACINIAAFVRNIYYVFKPLAEKNDIDFLLFTPGQKIMGYLDCRVVEKILYNLLSNAFKYTPPNKRIELVINRRTSTPGVLELIIRDEGKGIEKKLLSRLFERFYRSENSSGLGLFFVKELVMLHKGEIEVASEISKGTSVKLLLPIHRDKYSDSELSDVPTNTVLSAAPIIPDLHIRERELLDKNKRDSILIIDDNHEMRSYIGNKLKDTFQVFTAGNGEQGLATALQEIPDIIICDVMMPVLDGIEVTRRLRRNFSTSHIPIILLTANSSDEKKFEGIELGADDYITKPFDFKYLKLKIDSLVLQRKQLLTRFSQDPSLSVDTLTRSKQDTDFIERVTKLIDKNIDEADFSVEMLAERMSCSRTNFYKKMKGITGETPHEFIRTIQMKKAALLLKETNHSIGEVGYMVGFSDANYFSKSFKKHFGKSPKAYQLEKHSVS